MPEPKPIVRLPLRDLYPLSRHGGPVMVAKQLSSNVWYFLKKFSQ
jgi:hypothetical protein